MICVDHLCYHYKGGQPILRDVSFELETGHFLAVLGNNGVGKSTLLKCMNRILTADSGHCRIDGEDLLTLSHREIAKRVAFVAQHVPDTQMTVHDMVMLGRRPYMTWGDDGARPPRRTRGHALSESGGHARPVPQPALRRRAAEGHARPRAGAGANAPAAGRTDQQSRHPQSISGAADHARSVPRAESHGDDRHPRPEPRRCGSATAFCCCAQARCTVTAARRSSTPTPCGTSTA